MHPGSPASKPWSRFGNHVAYHVSVTSLIEALPLKGLFNNPTFEIGFERIKRQFSQNNDIDGTRSTKIHKLKHFKFGAVATVKAQGDLHSTKGKNKDFGPLGIPYLCTG